MKNGTNKTSMSMVPPTNDDLKAIHSIEAILGIKNLENHQHHQQHLYSSHSLSSTKFGNKKRSSNEHYPESKSFIKSPKIELKFFLYFQIGKLIRRNSSGIDPLIMRKTNNNNNSEDDIEGLDDDDDDNDSNDCLLSNHQSNSKKKHRRNRTTFTTFQLHELERAFEKSRKIFKISMYICI
jgi:hypothetical protein